MTTIEMKGELSVQNAENIKSIFLSALQKKGDILLDFSTLEDIDVSTVQLLYCLFSGSRDRNITIQGPVCAEVRHKLHICGIITDETLTDDATIKTIIEKMRDAHE